MSGEIRTVTKDEPCLHCGKGDWCYRIGELSCCKREADPADGWCKTGKSDKERTLYYALKGTAKAVRPKSKKEFVYHGRDGKPLVQVSRSDDGTGQRKFWQSYYLNGKPVKGLPKPIASQCPIYRYPEVKAAIAGGSQIFLVEGEGVADKLWEIGIAATTSLGGSGKYRAYGSYLEDLAGADLVLCPDRDTPGLSYMEEVAKDFPGSQWLYAPPSERIWNNPPENGGLDLVDWIADGATKEQILAAVGEKRSKPPEQVAQTAIALPEATDTLSFEATMEMVGKILDIDDEARQEWELGLLAKAVKAFSGKSLLTMYKTREQAKKRFNPIDYDEFINNGLDEREWVVAAHISAATTLVLFADGGVGKSLLAYDLCKAIATGASWNGFYTKQGKVLIIQTDEPEIDTRERLLIANFPREVAKGTVFIETDWQFSQIRRLREWVERERPTFIMIDSLSSANRVCDDAEKDSTYGIVLYDLRDLANEFGCAIMVIHHENKMGGARGTTAIRNNVSEVWRLSKPDAKDNLSSLHRILEIEKSRSGCSGKFQIELNVEDYSWQHQGDFGVPETAGLPLTARILNYLESHRGVRFEPEELVHEFGGSTKEAIRKALERHRKKGLLHAEERIKQREVGAARFKVYYSPEIKVAISKNSVQRENLESESHAAQEESSLDTSEFSLDTFAESEEGVQRGKSSQGKDSASLDTSLGRESDIFSDWEELLNEDQKLQEPKTFDQQGKPQHEDNQ